jgi:ribosomal protein L11 methyltransferase
VADADVVVELPVDAAGAELAAAELWASGATAVHHRESVTPGRDLLVASFPSEAACRQVAGALGGTVVRVPAHVWRDAWRAHAVAVDAGPILVVPAWRAVPLAPGRVVLEIDPGACFGSGSHPSTRLILETLARDPPVGLEVLDVGTGSGILAVAAARLGAHHVRALDLDPEAVTATVLNAERNRVADRIEASTTPIGQVGARFDLVLVNVTAAVQVDLAADVVRAARPGGRLVLAGLLPGQWPHVQQAYPGCQVVRELSLDGWVGALLETPS